MIRNSYTGSKTRKITRHDKSIGFCIQESFISKMLKRVLKYYNPLQNHKKNV